MNNQNSEVFTLIVCADMKYHWCLCENIKQQTRELNIKAIKSAQNTPACSGVWKIMFTTGKISAIEIMWLEYNFSIANNLKIPIYLHFKYISMGVFIPSIANASLSINAPLYSNS